MSPDEAWRAGRAAFEAGAFHAAHAHWEVVWRAADPGDRRAYQALIQLAAACHKIERQEFRPARSLLKRALSGLETVARLRDVDLAALNAQIRALLVRMEASDPIDPACFPRLPARP